MDYRTFIRLVKSGDIVFVDLRFVDLRGAWQHMSVPSHEFTQKNIENGFGFDGSSIKGFSTIFESDMLLMPDLSTLTFDPFFDKTVFCICDVYDPLTRKPFDKDPRSTARRAEEYLQKSGIADISYWGPEIEFFVFDGIWVNLSSTHSYVQIKNQEFANDPEEISDGYKTLNKGGYFPAPPFDKFQAFRSEMVMLLEKMGVEVEVHHHEVASGGQTEIDIRYNTLTRMADNVMKYKYVARNLAKKYGMHACFLPKPLCGDNGSGMHTHQSLFKRGRNLFYDSRRYAELSVTGMQYLAGLLTHINTLLAITNPTLNSYRRIVPHFEAPTSIAFSARNRSAAIRIPMYFKQEEKAKRLEFRIPDPTCNPYLSFAAQLLFGLDGIQKKMDPEKLGFGPYDENIWENEKIMQTENNFFTVLANLQKDTILTKNGVFTKSLIESYIEIKTNEAKTALLYPTPSDFWFYGDI
jgi:glutamine synthetase